jgi:hypothetical protein
MKNVIDSPRHGHESMLHEWVLAVDDSTQVIVIQSIGADIMMWYGPQPPHGLGDCGIITV